MRLRGARVGTDREPEQSGEGLSKRRGVAGFVNQLPQLVLVGRVGGRGAGGGARARRRP